MPFNEVEGDEAYVIVGHKGQLTAIAGLSKASMPNPKALAEALAIATVTAS
jgi:hypothetical protein